MNVLTRRLCVAASVCLLLGGALPALAASGHGYLGVMLQDITPSMAKALQLGDRSGVLVTDVIDGSPADEAGLQDGDVILEFDGEDVADSGDLTRAVRRTDPGDKIKLLVLRDGEEEKVKVEMGDRPDDRDFTGGDEDWKFWIDREGGPLHLQELLERARADHGYLGVGLDDINDQLGDFFGVQDGKGALVTEVYEDSPAAEAGLKAGDVIVKAGDEAVASAGDLMDVMRGTEPGDTLELTVVRKGKQKTFAVKLAEMPEGMQGRFPRMFFMDRDHPYFGGIHPGAPGGDDDADVIIRRHPKGAPRVEILRREIEDAELDELHEELDKLRDELKKLNEEVQKLK